MSDWKFDVDEVGPDATQSEESAPPVEPGSPRVENVIPFVAGVALALVVFSQVL